MDSASDNGHRLEPNGNLLEKQTHFMMDKRSTAQDDVFHPRVGVSSTKYKVLSAVFLTFIACLGAFRKDLFQLRKPATITLVSIPHSRRNTLQIQALIVVTIPWLAISYP